MIADIMGLKAIPYESRGAFW